MRIKVAIIDDHPLVRGGISALLGYEPDIELCGNYSNSNQMLADFRTEQPDVLLLDLQMPDTSGFDLIPQLAAAYPSIRIIVLTSIDSALMIRNLLNSGAKGYLLKTDNQEHIAEAIREVAKGQIFLSEEVKNLLSSSLLNHKTNIGFHKDLSERELQILQLLYEEYTSPEIAARIHLSVRTVENYRLGLLQKLDAKNITGLIKKAIMMGLVK